MARNLTAAQRREIRLRDMTRDERREKFARSLHHSREGREILQTLQGPPTSTQIASWAESYNGDIQTLSRILFYRFQGVSTLQGGLSVSDDFDKWPLIDELKGVVGKYQEALSAGNRGRTHLREIERLITLIDPPRLPHLKAA